MGRELINHLKFSRTKMTARMFCIKMKKEFIILILLLGSFFVNVSAQIPLDIPEKVIVQGDSLLLIGQNYRGSLHYERSIDLASWENVYVMGSDSFIIIPDTTIYYRLALVEGTCNELYSDTVFIRVTHIVRVKTLQADSVRYNSAILNAIITDAGESVIETVGFYYDTISGTVNHDNFIEAIFEQDSFSVSVSGLLSEKTYYYKAFAQNGVGINYGNEQSFTTKQISTVPEVRIISIDSLWYTEAFITSEVTDHGGELVILRGVCWDTTPQPTVDDFVIYIGGTVGPFTSHLTSLNENETYYIRAFAENIMGFGYSNEMAFTTPLNYLYPSVFTNSISDISDTSAICAAYIEHDGNSSLVARGICWDTLPMPDTSKFFTMEGADTGRFFNTLNDLQENTTYYVRAYAINSVGIAYGNQITLKTHFTLDNIIDERDGQDYATVKIGDQWWMAENLNFGTNAGSFYYNDDSMTNGYLGRLYQWNVAQYVCPSGWRLPSDDDWIALEMFLGMPPSQADLTGWRGTDQGTILKEGGSSGFDANLGGRRTVGGSYVNKGSFGYYWTTTDNGGGVALYRSLSISLPTIGRYEYPKKGAFYVRCVKDVVK